jgi:hypothetical protein
VPAEITVRAKYTGCADHLFDRASHFSDLIDATSKISTYVGLPSVRMVEGATYKTDIKVFGIFDCKDYHIRVDRLCDQARLMESHEFSESVKFWSHRLHIQPTDDGAVWTDHVVMDAGLMTPILARYARFMYQHRHKQREGVLLEANLKKPVRRIDPKRLHFFPAE